MRTPVYASLLAAALGAGLALPASAGTRLHTSGYSTLGSVTVAVVQMPGGATVQSGPMTSIAELGVVSGGMRPTASGVSIARRGHSYVVSTFIGLRASSSTVTGNVVLQAFLDSAIPGVQVRIDGVDIAEFPVTFGGTVPIGIVTRHRIDLEIPNDMDPSRVPSEISLEFGAQKQ